MLLKNHIAYRFLTDDSLVMEMLQSTYPHETRELLKDSVKKPDDKVASLFQLLSKDNQKSYYITETVLDKLDMLHVKKKQIEGIGEHYDWTVFKHIKDQKLTFIFPNNALLRMVIYENHIHFCHVSFKLKEKSKELGHLDWVMFFVNRLTGEQCDHFNHIDVKTIETFIYRLLCFFYLSENEEIIVPPGRKYGTRKSGKLINDFKNLSITIVNSKWNITSIRTEGFGVRGHFAIRWSGEGRNLPKIVFIEPFEKKGYIRKATKKLN